MDCHSDGFLTRYAESNALSLGRSSKTRKFSLSQIFLWHGARKVFFRDRGFAFTFKLTQGILCLSNTSHRLTTPYHPQTNALTERPNKAKTDMIAMDAYVKHRIREEVLPFVTFAYNTAIQEMIAFSLCYLAHGTQVYTMLDVMRPHLPSDHTREDSEVVSQRAEEAGQLATIRIQNEQSVDGNRYNLRRRDIHFTLGDRVSVWTPVRRRCLS